MKYRIPYFALVIILLNACKKDDDASPPINANFSASQITVLEGSSVTFTDQSTNSPTNWEWTFEGGAPSASTDPNPSVIYSIPGIYDVTLKVTNDFEPDGDMITKQIVVLPTAGLVAYYQFNGNAEDQSGNGFNGTLNNGVSAFIDRNQEANQAYSFDGVDDYIVTSSEIDENLSGGASFSSWIYLMSVGTTMRIVSNYNGTGTTGNCVARIGFVFGVTLDKQFNIFYAIDGNDFDGRMTTPNSLEVNRWYHVVGTWDGTYSPSGFNLYIDGVKSDVLDQEEGSVSCGGYLESVNPFHIGIGHCSTGFCAPFNGGIDEVRIYNRSLGESEILALSKS